MSSRPWGYRSGPLQLVSLAVDSTTTAIEVGDFVKASTAGYIEQASAGDTPLGVAWESCASPSADGDISILVNIATDAVYEYPPDTGTVTQGLVGTTVDVGGAQSVNIDASADDILIVHAVDTIRNTVFVRLIKTYAGVA